jgi:hypothetical protein
MATQQGLGAIDYYLSSRMLLQSFDAMLVRKEITSVGGMDRGESLADEQAG